MLAVEEGSTVELEATVTNLGEAFMVDARVSGTADGDCARCLKSLHPTLDVHVNDVFGASPDFIQGDEAEDGEEPLLVEDNTIDISQLVIDEAGLNTPFSPTCAEFAAECEQSTPAPDGISEEQTTEGRPDPRWAGLEKFKFNEDEQ